MKFILPSKFNLSTKDKLYFAEISVAGILLLLIIFFHVAMVRYSGGFLRDEASSLNLASRSLSAGVHNDLLYDSFPPVSIVIFHIWGLFSQSDLSFKLLGFVIGMGIIGAIWFSSVSLGTRLPIIALVIFELNPIAIRYGDGMRPYGLGIIFILLSLGFVWKLVKSPTFSQKLFFLAAIFAILSVQTTYQNSFLLLGICAGGAAVAWTHKNWGKIWQLAMIGLAAIISLVPYIGFIRHARSWSIVAQDAYNPTGVWPVISQGLGAAAPYFTFVLLAVILTATFWFCVSGKKDQISQARKDLFYFSVVTLIVSIPLFVIFLQYMRVPTQTYYFIPILALIAVCLEAIFVSLIAHEKLRIILNIIIVFVFLTATFQVNFHFFRTRGANIDIIGHKLTVEAGKKDLIITNPWQIGVSFNRYYRGPAEWTSMPPLGDLSIFRYDLMRQTLSLPDPTLPVFQKAQNVLTSGNHVWVVGMVGKIYLPKPTGVFMNPYIEYWNGQLGEFMANHATQSQQINLGIHEEISSSENFSLTVYQGWKD